MLERHLRVFQNPWSQTIPNDRLTELLTHIASLRAEHVERHHGMGVYTRNSLGLALLNPQAPLWQSSGETLLATIAIGPFGEDFVINAVAKAVYHRDHGQPAGFGVYVDLAQSGDGDFAYGYSTQVDGTIAGASGQTELQDAMEAGHAAVTLNYMIRFERKQWFERQKGRPHWFSDEDKPGFTYDQMLIRSDLIADVSSSD